MYIQSRQFPTRPINPLPQCRGLCEGRLSTPHGPLLVRPDSRLFRRFELRIPLRTEERQARTEAANRQNSWQHHPCLQQLPDDRLLAIQYRPSSVLRSFCLPVCCVAQTTPAQELSELIPTQKLSPKKSNPSILLPNRRLRHVFLISLRTAKRPYQSRVCAAVQYASLSGVPSLPHHTILPGQL